MNRFGMDSRTLAGSLEERLSAIKAAGFAHVMLWSSDLLDHPQGLEQALESVRASELRVTGLQLLRDFEGLTESQDRADKRSQTEALLALCARVQAPLLLTCSSVAPGGRTDQAELAADLRELATLAASYDIRIAYEALSWGYAVRDLDQAWSLVRTVDHRSLGLAIDSFHMIARETQVDVLQAIDPARIFVVQLADCLQSRFDADDARIHVARHERVFPGSGSHGALIARLLRRLEAIGYQGDYSLEVFGDPYWQQTAGDVARLAAASRNSLIS